MNHLLERIKYDSFVLASSPPGDVRGALRDYIVSSVEEHTPGRPSSVQPVNEDKTLGSLSVSITGKASRPGAATLQEVTV